MDYTTPQSVAIIAVLALVAVCFIKPQMKFIKIVLIVAAIGFLVMNVLPQLGI